MKNTFMIAVLLCSMATNALSQQTPYISQKIKDGSGNIMLLGKCSRFALNEEPFANWFNTNYAAYVVDSATCKFIAPLLKDKTITIFMGTWCGDSRREVPRILKMLDCCGFPNEQLQMIMVNNDGQHYKQSPTHEEEGRNIVRVPTVIIEEKGKEKGRIVEYPVVSLEKDLLKILRKEGYVPNYHDSRVNAR